MLLSKKGGKYYGKKKKRDYMDRGTQIQKTLHSPGMSAGDHTPAYFTGRSNCINAVIKEGFYDKPDTAAYRNLCPSQPGRR